MFEQRTLDFLYFNRKNNSPEWYKLHKEDYEKYVLEPMKELVSALAPTMLKIDADFVVDAKVDRCISRIYRDMRYATDGYRYRENVWCIFALDKKQYDGLPGYYFEVSPYNFGYGIGYYKADGKTLKNIRELILSGSKEFKAAEKCFLAQKELAPYGESARSVKSYPDLSPVANDWLNRQNFGLSAESKDINLLFGEDLPSHLAKVFLQLKPYYLFLKRAEMMKRER